MRCIFCLEERASSDEHVFPYALGGTLIITRVCEPCNSWLGTNVDSHLTDHIGVLMKRFLLKIRNRSGKTIELDDILGVGTLATDPEQRVKLVCEQGTGKVTPRLLYKSERSVSEDCKEVIKITIDERQVSNIGKIIESTYRRERLPSLSQAEMRAKIEEVKDQILSIEQPCVRHDVNVDLIDYQKAILKIAYELAWLWLGDSYLDDPIANKLRRAILKKSDEQIIGTIQIGLTAPFDTMWIDEPNAILAFGQVCRDGLAISIRIFDVLCGFVVISEEFSRYPQFHQGRFFCCNPQTKATRDSTFPEEVMRIVRFNKAARPRA
jgi:hypothetical protein